MPATPDTAVAAPLAAYDADRTPAALQEAAAQAARNDGQTFTDLAKAATLVHQRLADWIAILARFRRDIDPAFDPDKRPVLRVAPPGLAGRQYMPGVDPADVADPNLRAAYIAAIKQNNDLIAESDRMHTLIQMHRETLEAAASSLADARSRRAVPTPDMVAMLAHADITPADRTALRTAIGN